MEKNFVKRSCDSPLCDTTEIIPQGEQMTGPVAQQLAHWIAVQVHEARYMLPPNAPPGSITGGQWNVIPTLKLACRQQCAINILKTGPSTDGAGSGEKPSGENGSSDQAPEGTVPGSSAVSN